MSKDNTTQLFIPDKCKVGFNLRDDTYTGKLGYIIYNDGKKWRKEYSWENWRQKEGQEISHWREDSIVLTSDINPVEFKNEQTEGFVLNKNAGGYGGGWNTRQSVCRIYDPRGWEFEISIENLLFILQESNSLKGKGLEGEYVYSWSGKDLVLLPAHSQDFKNCMAYTKLQDGKIYVKDLEVGAVYELGNQDKYVYLGRFDNYNEKNSYKSNYNRVNKKQHIFCNITTKQENQYGYNTYQFGNVTSFKQRVDGIPVDNLAELIDTYHNSHHSSEIIEITEQQIIKIPITTYSYYIYKKVNQNQYDQYQVTQHMLYNHVTDKYEYHDDFDISIYSKIELKNGYINSTTYNYDYRRKEQNITEEELKSQFVLISKQYKNNLIEKI